MLTDEQIDEQIAAWNDGMERWRTHWAPMWRQMQEAIAAMAPVITQALRDMCGPLLSIPAGAISPKFDAARRHLRGLMLAAARRRARAYSRRRRHPHRHH